MSAEVIIRNATMNDAKDLLSIYAYYVTYTAISFEYDVPTVEEFANRISKTLQKYPYIIAVIDGKIVCTLPEGVTVPIEVSKGLFAHNIKEFSNLAAILPTVYSENKNNF